MFCGVKIHAETQKINDNLMNVLFPHYFKYVLHDSKLLTRFIPDNKIFFATFFCIILFVLVSNSIQK